MDLNIDQTKELTRIREILKDHPKGLTIEDISRMLPLNRTSTAKYLNTLLISGQAEMETFGRAKVFTLSRRIPFSQVLNLSSDLMLILDEKLSINQVNEPLSQYFGITAGKLAGLKLDQTAIISSFSPGLIGAIQDAVNGKESTRMESIEIRGTRSFFRIKLIPCVFDEGEKGLTIIFEDLTELKKYQDHLEQLVEARTRELISTNERLLEEVKKHRDTINALERSERRYRELLENANSMILRTDGEGHITFVSELAEKFFGISESEVLGKTIVGTLVIPPFNSTKDLDTLNREFLVPAKHMMFKETEAIRKNKEESWVAWTIKELYDSKENFREFLIIGLDITTLKLYVERSQKMVIDLKENQISNKDPA